MRIAICAAVLAGGLILPADAQQTQPVAVPVGVVKAEKKPIAQSLDFVGRVEAVDRVGPFEHVLLAVVVRDQRDAPDGGAIRGNRQQVPSDGVSDLSSLPDG